MVFGTHGWEGGTQLKLYTHVFHKYAFLHRDHTHGSRIAPMEIAPMDLHVVWVVLH